MTVQETSREAYSTLQPGLGEAQARVLDAFRVLGPSCNQEVANYLGWSINRVTGRVRELVEGHFVREAFRDVFAPTGRKVIYWKAV